MGSEDGSYGAPDGQALTGQIGRFFVVGILATATHYLVAMLWLGWVSVWLANLLGYLAAVAVSYFGHQRITFRVPVAEVSHQRQAPRFLSDITGWVGDQLPGVARYESAAVGAGLVVVGLRGHAGAGLHLYRQ